MQSLLCVVPKTTLSDVLAPLSGKCHLETIESAIVEDTGSGVIDNCLISYIRLSMYGRAGGELEENLYG